ncbi:DUF221-domain-containing protein [Rhizodiscina lignyota]|uniref:DUF221-domain-containing protein n=1 Tax=Rhizodiscina lignyota TaxID=1504668 RepID=A0A9P4ILW9_9PEZI|nr:DUF221-domain-containing protein [Rhizodiscina lignyota]
MSDIVSVLNGTINGAAGSAQGKEGTTIQTFAISLASGFILFAVQGSIFLIIRNYLWAKRIYQPRSFLVPVKQRIKPPHNNPFKWILDVFKIKEDPDVLQKAGMDAYFFLRYLSMCLKIFFPMALIVMPILIPLNIKQGKDTRVIDQVRYNVTGLDKLGWSNVSPENTGRYWAHLVLAVVVIIWICYVFHQELAHYIKKRHEFLASPGHRLKASSTTVLIMDIPEKLCTDDALMDMYGDFPGGVRRIWLNRDFSALVNKDKLRRRLEDMLENAETNLIRMAVKKHKKASKRNNTAGSQASTQGESDPIAPETMTSDTERATKTICERDLQYDIATRAAWTEYLTPKQRSTMRIPRNENSFAAKIPLIGRLFTAKVDTIYYCRRELARLNRELETDVESIESYPLNRSAFIQFNTQKAAQLACQSVADTSPSHMKRRIVEISPGDINWDNLNLAWRVRYVRVIGFLVLYVLLLILFGLVAFFTGILSRASTLSDSTPWLGWIQSLPSWLISFIQGTLPPVIQVIILSGPLPILLRAMTNHTRGSTTGQEGERSLQLWYLIFLVFELFLIPTISSGLTSILRELIHQPTSVPNILATDLPTSSNYYFSFLVLQALSLSATALLQTIRLFNFYVIGHVNTPDSVFEKLSWTNRTRIGSNIPWYTTFAVIGIVYSIVAPLILVFELITFGLFWLVIKNNLLYCVRTGNVDGGGLWFPNAINQTFTGLYFMEICLIGLFFLVRDTHDKVACDAQGVIMAVVLVLTVLYHIWLWVHLRQLFKYAPVRLSTESKDESKDLLANDEECDVDEPEEAPAPAGAEKSAEDKEPSPRPDNPPTNDGDSDTISDMILARINRPLNETRLRELEKTLGETETNIGNYLMPRRKDIEAQMMNDPISKIILQHNDELETLEPEERDMLVSVAFTHPVLRSPRPCVWIPMDDLGVSDDEVKRTKAFTAHVDIENKGAFFDRKLKVQVNKPPPDMSEFALVMNEL